VTDPTTEEPAGWAAQDEDEVAGPPRTGHESLDAALTGLAAVADRPPAEQIDAYESLHGALRETLSTIEEG
jgi:hypothetical protein